MYKPKHLFRTVSVMLGAIIITLALIDGYNNFLPYLDSKWLIGAGVVLVGLAARKSVIQTPK